MLAGADPHQFWVFAGDSLAQPIVGRDRRDGELRTLTFHVLLTNPPFGTSASVHTFATHAERGPLVIPDHVSTGRSRESRPTRSRSPSQQASPSRRAAPVRPRRSLSRESSCACRGPHRW